MSGLNGTANGHSAETIPGVVAAVNEKGLRLEGRDGWLNYSKWAADVVPPARGAHVVVTLDKAGFVRALAPSEATDPHQTAVAGRETAITRLAVLKAAAAFAASRLELKSGDVLAIAERWEHWVRREEA